MSTQDLCQPELAEAHATATARCARFRKNVFDDDFMGARGEIAVRFWAQVQAIAPVVDAFRDPLRYADADLYLGRHLLSIDVKTTRGGGPFDYPEDQVERLCKKAAVVVWCRDYSTFNGYGDTPDRTTVDVVGWSRAAAIFGSPVETRQSTKGSYQVRCVARERVLPLWRLIRVLAPQFSGVWQVAPPKSMLDILIGHLEELKVWEVSRGVLKFHGCDEDGQALSGTMTAQLADDRWDMEMDSGAGASSRLPA